jgi:hypothetical protein
MVYNMTDYIDQTVKNYTDLAGSSPLKKGAHLACPDGSSSRRTPSGLSADACGDTNEESVRSGCHDQIC